MASDAPPFEFLWIVKESAYGTTMNTPSAGTDSIYIRLDGANRFKMRPKPVRREIGWGGGFAVPGYVVSDKMDTTGQLQVTLCYSQAKLLLDWAATRMSGGTTPWTSSEPTGDLASCSVFHGIARDDGTIKRRKYLGVKVLNWSLASTSEAGILTLSMNLRAQKPDSPDPNSTAFPAPADTAFATDFIIHRELTGTAGGSALSYLNGLTVTAENTLDNPYFTSQYPAFDRLRGRNAKCDLDVLYTATPDWRSDFEALTRQTFTAAWTDGTHTVTLDFQSQNVTDNVEDDLTPGKVYMQAATLKAYYDTGSSDLLTFTYA